MANPNKDKHDDTIHMISSRFLRILMAKLSLILVDNLSFILLFGCKTDLNVDAAMIVIDERAAKIKNVL
jgi:hypothetical protein